MTNQQQLENVRHLELRKLAVHGAVSGLFFAQTVTWQQLVDVLVVHVAGVTSDDPWFALWRALLVTLMTTGMAWLVLWVGRRCETCSRPTIEVRSP